jgi:hypothetical protein
MTQDQGEALSLKKLGVSVLLALCMLMIASASLAQGAGAATYEFDPLLSLTGDCSTSSVDKVPDPGCPNPPHPGAFSDPTSIAIDDYGNEYVANWGLEGSGGRIDIFDPTGHYITSLPDPYGARSLAVDSEGNLYAFEQIPGGDGEFVRYPPSSPYNPATGEIAYDGTRVIVAIDPFSNTGGVAVDRQNDHLFVSHGGVEEFSSAAEGNQLLGAVTNDRLRWSTWVAVDAKRERLYASSCPDNDITHCWVLVFESHAPYDLLEEVTGVDTPEGRFLSGKGWTSIAVDEETGRFFIDDLEQTKNVYEFDSSYNYVSTITYAFIGGAHPLQIAVNNALGSPSYHYLFVPSHPAGTGHAFAFRPASETAPEVKAASAANIGQTEAALRATVIPNGGDTEYVVEYVSQERFEEGGFAEAQVAGSGTISAGAEEENINVGVTGLSPGTSYRFRVVARNAAGEDAFEGTFATYSDPLTTKDCPNQVLRTGYSALLPDCRVYELVTPASPNGRAPTGNALNGDMFKTLEASPQGSAVSYFLEGGALPGTEGTGSFNGTLYRAERGSSGWTTADAGPSGRESTLSVVGSTSPDQGYGFWAASGEGPAVVGGQETRYVRYPSGISELIGRGSLGFDPTAKGRRITENGSHIIFQTVGGSAVQLEPNAPSSGTQAVYDLTADGVTHVVSLLPGDKTPAAGEGALYVNSSDDGSAIAFEIGSSLYVRVDNQVTYEVGEGLTFEGLSEDGRRLFYLEEGKLFAFDTVTQERLPFVSSGSPIVVSVAPDGSRAYFVSTSVLSGSEQNPNGAIAKKGKENLYLSEGGQIRFVAILTPRDVEGESTPAGHLDGLGLWAEAVGTVPSGEDAKDPSRLSADGTVLLFQSRANLTGYDSGGYAEIYRYDSAVGRLQCLSCIPTGEHATGGASLQSIRTGPSDLSPLRAYIFVPNLRDDGRRAFFQSGEALVTADSDDAQDIYEWEEEGVGSCTRSGGCVYLISSGQSSGNNYLYGVSRSGDDAFFITSDTLVSGDDATPSIYDARVNGGFPEMATANCEGEGCRPGLNPPPSLTKPAKAAKAKRRHCPRGKRKVRRHGKIHCVKKHHRSAHHKSKTRKGGAK